jgi:hypothetical protein
VATLMCSDCGKPDVHLTDFFLVPDKVWDALCPLDAINCIPAITAGLTRNA